MEVSRFVLLLALIINLSSILHANSSEDKSTTAISSESTCKDDSPVNKCFDHFVLSIFWPRGLGFYYLTQRKKIRPNLVEKNYWGIHGLWPAVEDGDVPETCKDQARRSQFNVQHFKNDPNNFYSNLELNWFNILDTSDRQRAIENFWMKEYDKHGCCAARAQSITNDVGYFKSALNMLNDINPTRNLTASGLVNGGTAEFGKFHKKLNENLKSHVLIHSVPSRNRKELYLAEIRVCYDLNLKQINCSEYRKPPRSKRYLPIRLLSRMP